MGFHVFDHTVTDPFTKTRPLTQPAIGIAGGTGLDDRGNFVVLGMGHPQTLLKAGFVARKQDFQ